MSTRKTIQTSKDWLWKAGAFLIAAALLASRAYDENRVANMQQTSFGTITDCNGSGRRYSCDYTFTAQGGQYIGSSAAPLGTLFGSTVEVYYDTRNPVRNSLEDFRTKSREDRRFVYVFLLVAAGFSLYGVVTRWDKPNSRASWQDARSR